MKILKPDLCLFSCLGFFFFHDNFIILKRYALTFIITNTTVGSKISSFKCLERNKENKCKSFDLVLPKALNIMKNSFMLLCNKYNTYSLPYSQI